ncbi:helix-turn-helix domain-containing protein [Planosporangium sp. 12N6]|uniref:helix-turn-helix domain-containing protein n=1 Tax=Planosporangium spinosum TaxID=3402278 RepID=UPI003CE812C9
MARHERAVDPAAGPLQRFAYELRKARAEAGNPTYRALAKTAGYSATTLSEAAGGLRKPTLEVVLAYVGACGGDVDEWRRRWYELDTELSDRRAAGPPELAGTPADLPEPATTPPDAAEPATASTQAAEPAATPVDHPGPPVPPPLSDPPRPGASARPRWRRRAVIASTAAVAVTAAVGIGEARWPRHQQPAGTASPTAGSCPKLPRHPAFTATTYGPGARARTGAARDQPSPYMIPTNCVVGFTGYCLGQMVYDATGEVPDVRWFKLEDGNVVSSAVVHGNPPETVKPSRCEHDRPSPDAVALAVSADPDRPGGMVLSATGANLDLVGFAVSYGQTPGRDGTREWKQVGFTAAKDGLFTVALAGAPATAAAAGGQAVVAATACLGGDDPTDVVDVKAVRLDPLTASEQHPPLDRRELTAAGRAACQYPTS